MEMQENVNEYHSVFANTLITVFQAILNKKEAEANKLLITMIRYVYTLIREEQVMEPSIIVKELDALNLQKMDNESLIIYLAFFQSQAGMKPVQTKKRTAYGYNKIKSTLES